MNILSLIALAYSFFGVNEKVHNTTKEEARQVLTMLKLMNNPDNSKVFYCTKEEPIGVDENIVVVDPNNHWSRVHSSTTLQTFNCNIKNNIVTIDEPQDDCLEKFRIDCPQGKFSECLEKENVEKNSNMLDVAACFVAREVLPISHTYSSDVLNNMNTCLEESKPKRIIDIPEIVKSCTEKAFGEQNKKEDL